MNSDEPIGIIELDNTKLKCLIFKITNNNNFEILSTSNVKSDGIHNGVIVNLEKATIAIRSCVSSAEKLAKVSLKKINVVFEGPEFLCTNFSKQKKINGSKIHKEDIEFLLNEAKKQLLLNDKSKSVIHIFNHNYIVDNKKFIEEPIGVYADHLKHEMTFISVPSNNLKNINQVFIECDLEVERFISSTFALGAKLLNNKELEYGAIIINVGFEKISIGLFKNFSLVHSYTYPVGTNHLTKDISKVCSLNLDESKLLRDDIDLSFENSQIPFDKNNYLKNDYFINSSFRKISQNLIINVVKSRLDEMFEVVRNQINISGFNLNFTSGHLLIGNGEKLLNLDKYCTNLFGPNIRKFEEDFDKTQDLENTFKECLGALSIIKDGWETEALPQISRKNNKKNGFFSKIFS